MRPLEKKIAAFVKEQSLLSGPGILLLGVSGGVDSLALLYIWAALRDEFGVDGLVAVYVDHGLRPAEVGKERQKVADCCLELGAEFVYCQVDVAAEQEKGKSLEHAARDLRYGALAEVAALKGAVAIAVGHTADDQAEELLLRLLRGTGRAGLSGMLPRRYGQVIRPLLTTAKDDLCQYLQQRGVAWCEDSSNSELFCRRNQVRLEIMPFLEKYNPALRRGLQRMALVLRDEEDFLEKEWQRLANGLIKDSSGAQEVAIAPLLALHPAMQRRCVAEIFLRLQGQPSVARVEGVLALARHGEGNSQRHFANGLRLIKKRGILYFSYPQGRGAKQGNLVSTQLTTPKRRRP